MNIVVFCSSADGLAADWQAAAEAVGRWIGANGHQLVYGGVDAGLMRTLALSARGAGASVAGVVPVRRRDMASQANSVLVPASDLNDRKGMMQILGDVFVVLPGGYGTLDEFASAFAYLNFSGQKRPVVIFNPDGFYDPLLQQLVRMASLGLMPRQNMDIITEARTAQELIAALDAAGKNMKK